MGKTIDISAHLTNKRPVIKLSEDKVYEVNDRKSAIIILNQKMKSADLNDVEEVDSILAVLLGKKAVEEINEMDPSFADYQTILVAAMAAVMGEDFETAQARFREQANES